MLKQINMGQYAGERVKVSAPVLGEYSLKLCPVCSGFPAADVSVKKDAKSYTYAIKSSIVCTECGLSAPDGDTWNSLSVRYEEDDDAES